MSEKQTSENVKEAVLCFFLVAKIMADTASLELVARGSAINEMKKVGMLVAVEKLSTASTRGSANAAAIAAPNNNNNVAFMTNRLVLATPSAAPSLGSPAPKISCCRFVS